MDVNDYLTQLAAANHHGFGFLVAYGTTWLVAAVLGWRLGARVGAWAALFQGMVGLPLGLALTAVAAQGARPEDQTLNALSVYLGSGQLLVLPLAVALVRARRHLLAVVVLAVVLAVHLVPYSWLYGTAAYLVVAVVVAVGTAVVVARSHRARVPARTHEAHGAPEASEAPEAHGAPETPEATESHNKDAEEAGQAGSVVAICMLTGLALLAGGVAALVS